MTTVNQPATESETLPIIDFVSPLPGFPNRRRFVLVSIHDADLLFSLACLDAPNLRFLVAPPGPFFPEYAPEVDDETLAALGTTDPADLLLLLVVSAGEEAAAATVNLMAPIVIDQRTRRAVQLVLGGTSLPIREPLLMPRSPAPAAPPRVGAAVPAAPAAPSSPRSAAPARPTPAIMARRPGASTRRVVPYSSVIDQQSGS